MPYSSIMVTFWAEQKHYDIYCYMAKQTATVELVGEPTSQGNAADLFNMG